MKCIVLAGGSGDRLWPLSRRNFPKQFMEMRKGRSMFQEAILRNMPFCDEFIIVTNKRYENIARGQLQYFQGLNYSLLLETRPLKTAPSVITAALYAQPDDELLIVFTDHIIEGEYNSYIIKAKAALKENKFVALGIRHHGKSKTKLHYFSVSRRRVKFCNHPTKNCFIDCGIYATKASTILQMANPEYVERCRNIGLSNKVLQDDDDAIVAGIDQVLSNADIKIIEAYFSWTRITDISSYYDFMSAFGEFKENTIGFDNKDVEIVNTAKEQLIVANGLKDVLITNTRDAIYITKTNKESGIKAVARQYYEDKSRYFDESPIIYEKWGSKEILNFTDKCEISRITVYQSRYFTETAADGYSVNYFVAEGEARATSGSVERKKHGRSSSFIFKPGTEYTIANEGKRNLVLIQTKNLELTEELRKTRNIAHEGLVKLKPVLKDFLWGGTKIRDVLNKPMNNMQCIAESWELSAHPAGQSIIATGKYKGFSFPDYLSVIGKDQLGWKTQGYDRFPLMVKFIDAKKSLSVQVHPNDDYAFPIEKDYGKNEMWHVIQADPDAFIYVGFNKDVTKEEIKERIKKNTLTEVLNKIPVKSGETYFLRAGTVHAIGEGCLICEVQQSSNVTYRLYDYGRKDRNGKPRELHVNKALDVLDLKKAGENYKIPAVEKVHDEYVEKLIGECKYFSVKKYDINGVLKLLPSESTFQVVVMLDGKCKIGNGTLTYPTSIGDTWFCGSWDNIELNGKCSVLVVNI